MTDTRHTITVPYKPEDCLDTYGWLWARLHHGEAARWHLVSTHIDPMDEDALCICFHRPDTARHVDSEAADTWAGGLYLPCSPPNCTPADTAMLTALLSNGLCVCLTTDTPAMEELFVHVMSALSQNASWSKNNDTI